MAVLENGKRLVIYRRKVDPAWIDYNDHMNVGYYLLAFDQAVDELFDFIGLTDTYRAQHDVSTFAMETHLCFLREVAKDAPIRFEIQLLDLSDKHIHFLNMMYHDREGFLAATAETLSMHMDMTVRRGAPMRPEIHRRFSDVLRAHRDLEVPEQVGRKIGIRRKG